MKILPFIKWDPSKHSLTFGVNRTTHKKMSDKEAEAIRSQIEKEMQNPKTGVKISVDTQTQIDGQKFKYHDEVNIEDPDEARHFMQEVFGKEK